MCVLENVRHEENVCQSMCWVVAKCNPISLYNYGALPEAVLETLSCHLTQGQRNWDCSMFHDKTHASCLHARVHAILAHKKDSVFNDP